MAIRRLAGVIMRLATLLLILCLAALLLTAYLPIPVSFSIPASSPPANYDTAKIALKKLFVGAPQTLSQAGLPRAFLHDQPTENVFVLLHGLTNAPEQFDKLGQILFERGHNVVLPLTPGHGEAELMTDKLGAFTAQAMLDSADEAFPSMALPLPGLRKTAPMRIASSCSLRSSLPLASLNGPFRRSTTCLSGSLMPSFGGIARRKTGQRGLPFIPVFPRAASEKRCCWVWTS
jgi:hypothetical protein